MYLKKVCFVSFSGGKDSTLTLALALEKYRGTGIPVVPLFVDTGWEHPLTYKYISQVEKHFSIRIERLKSRYGEMESLILKKGIFPSVKRRFCTQYLKTETQRLFYERIYFSFPFETAEIWLGIRKEESRSRKDTEDYFVGAGENNLFEKKLPFNLYFRYPIKNLTEKEVFGELKKRKIPINPLYKQGYKRVGCFPCFLSKKEIIQVIERAYRGDKYAKQRLEKMKELDKIVKGRLHIDFELKELEEKGEQRAKMLLLPLVSKKIQGEGDDFLC